LTFEADDGAADFDGPGIQIDDIPGDRGGFADAQADGEHERDEVGEVSGDRGVVVGDHGAQLSGLGQRQRFGCGPARLGDGPERNRSQGLLDLCAQPQIPSDSSVNRASSSNFSTRCFSAVRAVTRSTRYRVRSRSIRIGDGGTKLGCSI